MPKFSFKSECRKKAQSSSTTVKVDGSSFKLEGIPTSATDKALTALVKLQPEESIRVKEPKEVTETGKVLSPSVVLSKGALADILEKHEKAYKAGEVADPVAVNGQTS